MKIEKTTHFEIRLGEDRGYALHPATLTTLEEALQIVKNEYRNRNKADGHDRYWRNIRTVIAKVVTESIVYFEETIRTIEQKEIL